MKKVILLFLLACTTQFVNAQALAVTVTSTNVLCNAGNTGTATANPTGGTSPYMYSWNPSSQTTQTATGLTAGIYTVTVTDAVLATVTTTVSVTQPTPMSVSSTWTYAMCGNPVGTAGVTVSGGTAPYSYLWAPTNQTTATATNLSGGSYNCTITDFVGCTSNVTVVVPMTTNPTVTITPQSQILCNGGTTTLTESSVGGTAPFTAVWVPGNYYGATYPNVPVGSYTCTVTDNFGCIGTQSYMVTQPTAITATTSSTPETCNNANGSATVTPSGGNSPYTYAWSPAGGNNATATNLVAGTYYCLITDANGCTINPSVIVSNATGPTASITSQSNCTCNGNCNGSVNGAVAGGTAPYTFMWSNSSTTSSISNVCAGSYTMTVTDANNCSSTVSCTITQPTPLTLSLASQTSVSCFGNCDGSGSVSVTGGTSPYTYLWSQINFFTPNANNICAGTYSVTVTDANGCVANLPVTITQPPQLIPTITSFIPAGCNNADGSASATATGGVGAYTYLWTPSMLTSSNAINLANTVTHTVTVTDANMCTATATVTIGDSCNYVWPGDANEDAVADNNDILAIGIANGATGTTRANATTNWIGQPSTNWGQTLLSGTDYKFVDCDGNGTIQNADTNAVVQNFGLSHNMRVGGAPVYDASLPDLIVTMNQATLPSGSPGSLTVSLGTSALHASNVYGVAFTLNFDPAQIDASSFGMNNSASWMGTVGNNLMGVVLKPATGSGFVQVAVTRYDHNNANGFGDIADLGFMTTSALVGTGNTQNVNFTISNVTVISANEQQQQVNVVNDSVNVVDPGVLSVNNFSDQNQLSVFPNPFNESTQVIFPSSISGKSNQMILTDLQGRIIRTENVSGANSFTLYKNNLEAGAYFCTIVSEGKTIGVTKIIVD